jgi:putative hemolysin
MRALLDRILAIDRCELIYTGAQRLPGDTVDTLLVRALRLSIQVADGSIARIPSSGPLLVVANHPRGVVDGLALSTVLRRARGDVRILANAWLARLPELRDLCFFVDPFGGSSGATNSLAGLRAAQRWLQQGGALVAFPSGEVAHRALPDGSYGESHWHTAAARLARASGATVVPAFIEGRNSRLFYAAGRIHPRLRTALLPRELLKSRGSTIEVRMGSPLSAEDFPSPDAATEEMFRVVEGLRVRAAAAAIEDEIQALTLEHCVLDDEAFQVFCAPAAAIPNALHEIGRLRAETYRDAGEGTGAAIDLDMFDRDYLHLFVWDRRKKLIAGAYRVGRADELAGKRGVEALYTRTLFRYDSRLLERFGPALELGRAFVRKEYQKSYNALLLLWKGIGRFVALHPKYRVLFGPVSVSPRYSDHSQQLLMAFLEQNHRDADLASMVEAINPPAPLFRPEGSARPELPVLLRQYLKLNARLIAFNIDSEFGGTLDALLMVDLCAVDRPILNRYLGAEHAAGFLAAHRRESAA